MRILVTGASGHVGGAVAAHLAAAGHEVVGLSRRPAAVPGLAEHVAADIASDDFDRATAALARCDAVVHAAAALEKDLAAPAVAATNCAGTQRVLGLARAWRAESVVYVSGIPVIGVPRELPITEDHPTAPATAYHASKLFGEHLMAVATADGLPAVSLRLPSPVGPGMPANRIVSVFVRQAAAGEPLRVAGAGTRRQNYVDVRDVARAVELAVEARAEGLFNVAGSGTVSNRELAELCVRTLGSESAIESSGQDDPEEGMVWDVSIAKAAEQLGWEPRHDLEESVRAVLASLDADPRPTAV